MNRAETSGRRFRRSALDLHLAYASLRPLIERATQLGVNAGIASARLGEEGRPFSEVAREIEFVAADLDELIGDAGASYRVLVGSVASWTRAARRRELFERGLKLGGSDEIQQRLQQRVAVQTEAVALALEQIREAVTQLARVLRLLRTVSARRSRFVGLTAAVESSRVQGGALDAVVGEIRSLAEDLAVLGQQASSGVEAMAAQVGSMSSGSMR